MAGRSISPWLADARARQLLRGLSRASCHEGGSSYGKKSGPKAEGPSDLPHSHYGLATWAVGPCHDQREPLSPAHLGRAAFCHGCFIQNSFSEQTAGDGWQPTGRRKNPGKTKTRSDTSHSR